MTRLFILLFFVMGVAWFALYAKRTAIKKSSFEAMRHFLVVLLVGVSAIGILSLVFYTIAEVSK